MHRSPTSSPWQPRWAIALLLAAFVLPTQSLASPATPPSIPLSRPKGEYRVHTIDVDQGQAILVQTLAGKNILIDAGEDYAAPKLMGYLKKVGVKQIDWLVISHRHMDHIAGVGPLAKKIPVKNLITPWAKDAVPTTAMAWLAPLRADINKPIGPKNRPKFHTATTGKVFDFGGGAGAVTVWPPKPTGKAKIGDHNEESVVMRVTQKAPGNGKRASFVVGGDLGWQLERHIAKKYPQLLRADGLVGNHHGSKGSFERTYLEAVAGRSSSLLKSLSSGKSTPEGKLARRVVQMAKKKHAKGLASDVGLRLYRDATNGKAPRDGKLSKSVATALKKDLAKGELPWVTYSAGHDNPYHHPSSERLALATLLGTTMLGTEVHGSVVMKRTVDKKGNWQGKRWSGHTMGTLGLPDVSDNMPDYKKKKDPKNPYDLSARAANYVFALKQPDPTVSWDQKEKFLAAPGQTENEKFLEVARNARRGKTRWIRNLVAKLRSDDPKVRADAEAYTKKWTKWRWDGVKLDLLPWDQGEGKVYGDKVVAQQNSRLRGRRGPALRRFVGRANSGLRQMGRSLGARTFRPRSLQVRARTNSALHPRGSSTRLRAQRNSNLLGRRGAWRPLSRRAAPRFVR